MHYVHGARGAEHEIRTQQEDIERRAKTIRTGDGGSSTGRPDSGRGSDHTRIDGLRCHQSAMRLGNELGRALCAPQPDKNLIAVMW
jgi:hypothetical protein